MRANLFMQIKKDLFYGIAVGCLKTNQKLCGCHQLNDPVSRQCLVGDIWDFHKGRNITARSGG